MLHFIKKHLCCTRFVRGLFESSVASMPTVMRTATALNQNRTKESNHTQQRSQAQELRLERAKAKRIGIRWPPNGAASARMN